MVHIIKDTILKDKNKDSVCINIPLILGMLDSGCIINKMELVHIHGLMERDTRVNGWMVIYMEGVILHGLMEENMRGSLSMIRSRDMECTYGLMEKVN